MKISNSLISFKRLLTPLEKIETRVCCSEAKQKIGLQDLAIVTHSVSFPSSEDEDVGIGLLSLNQGTKSYIDFLFDNAIDSVSIEPVGIIKPETYSPYEGSLLSKRQIVDLKELCGDEWANIFDLDSFNQIVENKNYFVQIPSSNSQENNGIMFDKNMVLYDYVLTSQKVAMKKAYLNFLQKVKDGNPRAILINEEFKNFKEKNDYFLKSDSIYSILCEQNNGASFADWVNPLHRVLFDKEDNSFSQEEKEQEIARLETEFQDEIEFYKFFQFVVDKQQKQFNNYCSSIARINYSKDREIVQKAFDEGKISKEKYEYLMLKLKEYSQKNKGVNIIGDKQVGYSDMDIYSNPSFYTDKEYMGAPPNLLKGSTGQDWDFRFIPYEKMFNKDGSIAPAGEYLKKVMKKAFLDNPGGLRIDHIIGLIDPWTYEKSDNNKISASKFNLFLLSQLKDLVDCGITSEKIYGLNDVVGAITGENPDEHKILSQKGGIDFVRAKEILEEKSEFLSQISTLDVPVGSRHIFKYLLKNELKDLEDFGFNQDTISGIIDPIKGIFDENSTERKFLSQRGIKDFNLIKEVIFFKQKEIDKVYSNLIENIVLAAAKEVIEQRFQEQGIEYNDDDVNKKAASLILCEDLGALTIPVKEVMKKYNLNGMRDAARSNPYDETNIYREINPKQSGNYWLISTHDTMPYEMTFSKYDDAKKKAYISYVADEMNLNPSELFGRGNLWKYLRAKVARIFAGDKNPKTPNRVILNWLDLFAKDKQYNTPGLYDKTKNWVLRICGSDENFEKNYYEQILPNKKGINIPEELNIALGVCASDENNDKLKNELTRLSKIAQE
ncbi:4-alpha-glucanotransferase [bacterium]|nr:4-alpha-glucanotransferase [bacterium]MBQ9149668.1 4-alpha-glucanotransferase [bacterium]